MISEPEPSFFCFYTPRCHRDRNDLLSGALDIKEFFDHKNGTLFSCFYSPDSQSEDVLLIKKYDQMVTFHCLFWPSLTLLGGVLRVGMLRKTQCLSFLCEKRCCIQRWGKWQSSLHGTAPVQTVACGEEQRKERRNLKTVARFTSWPSGTCRVCTWGPDYASSQTNRVETKLGYFMWERKVLKKSHCVLYSININSPSFLFQISPHEPGKHLLFPQGKRSSRSLCFV